MINPLYSDVSESVTDLNIHSSPEFYLHDFVNNLSKDNITKLINYDAQIAVNTGEYKSETEFIKQKYRVNVPQDVKKYDVIDLLHDIVISDLNIGHDEGFQYIIDFLDAKFTNPKLCAQFMSKKGFYKASLRYVQDAAKELFHEINGTPQGESIMHLDNTLYDNFVSYVEGAHKNDCTNRFIEFEHLYTNLSVEERHPLYPTKYSLILPQERNLIVLKPIQEVIVECSKYPKQIYLLKPREFEMFIAEIFRGFGFEVNLTAQTRDGGADIICMSYNYGIPFKLAIEVKKYKPSNPISVELVRSFVGANQLIHANKLVYVTTSYFTKDAQKFANSPGNTNLLELKELSDIIDWSNQYKKIIT